MRFDLIPPTILDPLSTRIVLVSPLQCEARYYLLTELAKVCHSTSDVGMNILVNVVFCIPLSNMEQPNGYEGFSG